MPRHLGKMTEGGKLENTAAAVIAEGKSVTYDMKPHCADPTAVGTSHDNIILQQYPSPYQYTC